MLEDESRELGQIEQPRDILSPTLLVSLSLAALVRETALQLVLTTEEVTEIAGVVSGSPAANAGLTAGDEITSVGRKCFAAKVDLPDPVEPMSTTREKSGISMSLSDILIG